MINFFVYKIAHLNLVDITRTHFQVQGIYFSCVQPVATVEVLTPTDSQQACPLQVLCVCVCV